MATRHILRKPFIYIYLLALAKQPDSGGWFGLANALLPAKKRGIADVSTLFYLWFSTERPSPLLQQERLVFLPTLISLHQPLF